jgi:hypothetical protein
MALMPKSKHTFARLRMLVLTTSIFFVAASENVKLVLWLLLIEHF